MRFAIAVAVALSCSYASASEISGRATVLDGDTVAVEGTRERIRLYGIDAPEGQQTCDDASGKRYLCGTRSADFLASMIGRNGRLTCVEEDRDRYGRIVAECLMPNGTNVNAEMVRSGWAAHFLRYSDGRYARQEAEARTAGRGLWAGDFILPWDWRRGQRGTSEQVASSTRDGCDIKGNINRRGDRIYHVPGQQHYDQTIIDESSGERWFCSEGEARSAGWRPSQR